MAEQKQTGQPIVRLVGRIEDVRRVNTANANPFVYLVKLPAADEFSSPATVRINAPQRVGEVGDKFDALVQVGGFSRTYQTTDEETGRKHTVKTADNALTLVG
jgi:hypothetical protein